MTTDDGNGVPLQEYLKEMRQASDARWGDLPPVIHAAFECAKCTGMNDALASLGVSDAATDPAPGRIYTSARDVAVFTVWHDEIEHESDGSLAHWIDAFVRPSIAQLAQGDAVHPLLPQLQKHAGHDAHVLLLKRGWDAQAVPMVEASAPDVVMWHLECAGQQWYALRRPSARRSTRRRSRFARVG